LRRSRPEGSAEMCRATSVVSGAIPGLVRPPAREPRKLAPGRFRGSARAALGPPCKELAGLGPGESLLPRKRGPELRRGFYLCQKWPPVERRKAWCPDRKGCRRVWSHTCGSYQGAFRRSASPHLCEGRETRTPARPRRKEWGGWRASGFTGNFSRFLPGLERQALIGAQTDRNDGLRHQWLALPCQDATKSPSKSVR
jgi:hypothetical protein